MRSGSARDVVWIFLHRDVARRCSVARLGRVLRFDRLRELHQRGAMLPIDQRICSQGPDEIRVEMLAINEDARPIALQVAILVPIIAALLGLVNGFRMMRRPDPVASEHADMALA
jgi:hypothetical protein